VRSANGPLWSREVTGTSLAYPADEDSLAPGTEWTWELTAFADASEIGTSVSTVDARAGSARAKYGAESLMPRLHCRCRPA
jgi:hypothetical protein